MFRRIYTVVRAYTICDPHSQKRLNSSCSSWSELIQGVPPQGSALGPILFNVLECFVLPI